MAADAPPTPELCPLEVTVAGRRRLFDAGRSVVIGRGDGADIDLRHPKVSREHAVLRPTAAGWVLTDRSRNGVFIGNDSVQQLRLTEAVTVSLGGASDGIRVRLRPAGADGDAAPVANSTISQQGRLSAIHTVQRPRITIGRLPDNDVVLDDLLVSRRHAELRKAATGWELVDLGSGNGTFVNGRRISSPVPITPSDVIGVGHGLLQLDGDRLVTYVDSGDNTFEARDLTVTTRKGKRLLNGINFALSGQSLLAVVGPSGAGKSTLLNALVGSRPADGGAVLYAERDLYQDYSELRHRIALVPQDDVLHAQLTVRQALSYAAQLRFPADTSSHERQRRIEEVLAELNLSAQADQAVASLSGGQRKRTSVALELLTKPSLLFLDEPTSGLDPGLDRAVMRTLRGLADDGRTVVVVTHSLANVEVCDRLLILATGGWVAYFGPPAEALQYFGQKDFADIFLLLATAPGEHWAQRFRASDYYTRYVGHGRTPVGSTFQARQSQPVPRQQGALKQFAVLCRRYLTVIASDRQYAIFLAVLPIVLSLLARAVPGSAGLSVTLALGADDPQPAQLLLVLIIGGSLMGAAAAVRELVKERPIYQRERAIGLSIGAYLSSKVVVLGAITGLQALIFVGISLFGRTGPDDPLVLVWGRTEVLLAVLAVTFTTMLVGLMISAVIDNADRGMPLLVLMVMVQLILCGGLFGVYDRPGLEQAAWAVPARWAFAMAAATAELSTIQRGPADPLWEHDLATWFGNAAVLAGIGVALLAIVVWRVAKLDPRRRTRL